MDLRGWVLWWSDGPTCCRLNWLLPLFCPLQVIKHKMIQQSRLVLDELEPWTKYCVQVQIHTEMNMKPSEVSRIVCESTSNSKTHSFTRLSTCSCHSFQTLSDTTGLMNLLCPQERRRRGSSLWWFLSSWRWWWLWLGSQLYIAKGYQTFSV